MTRRGNLAGMCNQSRQTVFLTLDSNMKVSIVATVKNEGGEMHFEILDIFF